MNLAQGIALGLLRAYKLVVSPVLHALVGPFGGCRFHPTCSIYAAGAVRQHGLVRGGCLAARRICRCHPWGGCGHDPVPTQTSNPLGEGAQQ
jgi:hypothetical protein